MLTTDKIARAGIVQAVENKGKHFFVYDLNRSPLYISPFAVDFGDNYLLTEMSDTNYIANLLYLNGCFACLRKEFTFLD